MSIEDITLWTALVTPMKESGELDREDLASLIHKQDEAGNGVLILGSTGEGLALGLEDKKLVVETASSLNIDVPLMVGVGGFNLREQIEWIEYCKDYDVAGFLLVTPLYAKPNLKGQTAWFKALLDAADKPCTIYNVPSRTGVKLYPDVLYRLRDHANLYALKEASGSIAEYQEFRKTVPDLKVFSGEDALMPYFAMAGCDGLISVASNIWPKATRRYLDRCLEGRGAELFPLWQECTKALFSVSNPIPSKVLLKEKGWIKTSTLRPPLTEEEIEDITFLKKADQRIQEWFATVDQIPLKSS